MATAVASKSDTQVLREFVDNSGETLKVETGVIKGVKVLGLVSKNGRTYLREAVERAAPLYEGAKVNVDHPARASDPRGYRDRLGVLKNVRMEGSELRADLHFNPKHSLAEALAWDAANAPQNVGLSHNVVASVNVRDGKQVVESISQVHSVDLVADPATTSGLFEAEQPMEPVADPAVPNAPAPIASGMEAIKKGFTDELMKVVSGGGTMPEMMAKIKSILKAQEAAMKALGVSVASDEPATDKSEGLEAKYKALQDRVDAFEVAESIRVKRDTVAREVEAAKLPLEALSPVFLESLEAAEPDKRKALIAERKQLTEAARFGRPLSVDQHVAEGAGSFAKYDDPKKFAGFLKS